MLRICGYFWFCVAVYSLVNRCNCVVYTYEDIELRRIFPSEFPQDTIRKSGSLDPEHLGRYAELKNYFKYPKTKVNSHFEELVCYDREDRKVILMVTEFENEDAYYGGIRHSRIKSRSVGTFKEFLYIKLGTCWTNETGCGKHKRNKLPLVAITTTIRKS